jgi:hypothetical protein
VKIPAGGTATIKVFAPMFSFAPNIQLELSDAPDGISIKKITPTREGRDIVVTADAAKVKPGHKGNLIVNVIGENRGAFGKGKGQPQQQQQQRRFPFTALPAIPFDVVEK